LSGVKVYGKEIKVTSSKHNSVSMPKEGDVSMTRVSDPPFIAHFKAIYIVCTDSYPFLVVGEQSNKGFYTFTSTSLQETWIQELPEYFPTKQNAPCVKYP